MKKIIALLIALVCFVFTKAQAQNEIIVESAQTLDFSIIQYTLSGPAVKGSNPIFAGNFLRDEHGWIEQPIEVRNGRYFFTITTYDRDTIEMFYAAHKKNGKYGDNWSAMKELKKNGFYFLNNPNNRFDGGKIKFSLVAGKIYRLGEYTFKQPGKYGDKFFQWTHVDKTTLRFFCSLSEIPQKVGKKIKKFIFVSNLTKWHQAGLTPIGSSGWAFVDLPSDEFSSMVEGFDDPNFMVRASYGAIPQDALSDKDYIYPDFTTSAFWNPKISTGHCILYDRIP